MPLLLSVLFISLAFGKKCVDSATPPLGFNSWCIGAWCRARDGGPTPTLRDVCNEVEMLSVARAIVDSGLQDAGYRWFNLDNCWSATRRSEDGQLMGDPDRFPTGMPAFLAKVRGMGFRTGLYLSLGNATCSSGNRPGSVPGSFGNFERDVATLLSWGVDYLKADWCHVSPGWSQPTLTSQLRAAVDSVTAKSSYPVPWLNFHCDDDRFDPATGAARRSWCPELGDSWRIAPDHFDDWSSSLATIDALKIASGSRWAKPHAWLDPDFLYTGGAGCGRLQPGLRCPGQTDTQYRTTFSLWAITSSSILVSADPRNMTAPTRQTLTNKEVLSVHQSVGGGDAGAYRYSVPCVDPSNTSLVFPSRCDVWSKPLTATASSLAIAVFNPNDAPAALRDPLDLVRLGAPLDVHVRDLWTGATWGPVHETVALGTLEAWETTMVVVDEVTPAGLP